MIPFNQKIYYLIITILVLVAQIYFPVIKIEEIQIQPDIILLYITILAILHGRFLAILVAFFLGLAQDFLTQVELLGAFSLAKSISAYCIGSVVNYRTIWSKNIQYSVIFLSYLIHFLIYFYLFSRIIFSFYYVIIFIFCHSIIVFILFLLFNNLVYKNKLL